MRMSNVSVRQTVRDALISLSTRTTLAVDARCMRIVSGGEQLNMSLHLAPPSSTTRLSLSVERMPHDNAVVDTQSGFAIDHQGTRWHNLRRTGERQRQAVCSLPTTLALRKKNSQALLTAASW
jgi:hypothetical protein